MAEPDRWDRLDLELPLSFADWVSAELVGWGCVGVELVDLPGVSRVRLSAFFFHADSAAGYSRLSGFMESLGEQVRPWRLCRPEPVPPADWAREWRHHFPALKIGRQLLIVPPWDAEGGIGRRIPIILQPGMAFGTGRHPSTTMVLEALERVEHLNALGPVLDIGCGSGVLSIGAARLGAERVLAVDYDEDAVTSARENVERNELSDRITVTAGRFPDLVEQGPFGLILANVYFTFFAQQAGGVADLVASGGHLLASGLEGEEGAQVAELLRAEGLKADVGKRLQGWSLVEAFRP